MAGWPDCATAAARPRCPGQRSPAPRHRTGSPSAPAPASAPPEEATIAASVPPGETTIPASAPPGEATIPAADLILIDVPTQTLTLLSAGAVCARWVVSTARHGVGERAGSECTPRGRHRVGMKIGAGAPLHAVFVGRRATGEIWSPALAAAHPGRDFILTRILWLEGLEPGRNQGGEVDTRARYIYIHGAPADAIMGLPGSRGCVRMHGADILELFERTPVGCAVEICG